MTTKKLDPTGKRALFEAPVAAARDRISTGPRNEGRTAVFSARPRRAGTAVIECSTCKARSRTSVVDVGLRLAALSAFIPLRRHPHWMRCPNCNAWRWCRIGWTE